MKIKLTDTESAQIMATHYATQRIEQQIKELSAIHAKHIARQAEIEKAIRARVKKLPKASITEWRFNLDPVTFEGDVDVPDDPKEEKGG